MQQYLMYPLSIATFHMKNTLAHIIVVKFMSESDLSVYILEQNFICWKLKRVGTLIKIRTRTLLDHESQNKIQTSKSR